MTAVMKGGLFEQRSLRLLREHLSMSLRRVGGKGDGGIDLQGWWWLPAECLSHAHASRMDSSASPRKRLRIVAQCKAEEKKIGPRFIREFEGTVLRHSAYLAPRDHDEEHPRDTRDALVGMFLSISPFTKASILQAYSSPIPLALLHLPVVPRKALVEVGTDLRGTPDDLVSAVVAEPVLPGTLVFNPALAGPAGLLHGMVEPRLHFSPAKGRSYPAIWSNGKQIRSWTPEDDSDNPETP
ncbi:hypothetical protein VTO73DRAFT_3709 [Trametes versicolor]